MMPNLEIAQVVADWGTVIDCYEVHGGCVSTSLRVTTLTRGSQRSELFVKINSADFEQNFRCEREGLERLAAVDAIRTAKPLKIERIGERVSMVMQWIERGGQRDFALFGQQLANLHHRTYGQRIGLDHDNFLGAGPQKNAPSDDWARFVQHHRIGVQLRRAVDSGLLDSECKRDVEAIIDSMPRLLAGRESGTCLLHGDLWSGNYLFDKSNQPVIFDPAIYYGCREAEFGMLLPYGSCPETFYAAYNSQWPLPPGWRSRCKVYVLYHLLNHLNLFGTSYLGQCKQIAHEILKEASL